MDGDEMYLNSSVSQKINQRKSPQKHIRGIPDDIPAGASGESVDGPRLGRAGCSKIKCSPRRDGVSSPASPSRRPLAQNSPKKSGFTSVVDLFEEMGKGTKSLIVQMSLGFRESEEYESVCLHNVETMLEEAHALERNLQEQKDLLQQRLYMIGQRLSSHDL